MLAGVATLALAAPAGARDIEYRACRQHRGHRGIGPGRRRNRRYDIDLVFDSATFAVPDVTFSGLLGDFATGETDQYWNSAGVVVDLYEDSFLSDDDLSALQQGNDFTLLSILFDGDVSNASFSFNWDAFKT